MKKIIFVCEGNTCRSPMAEKIFARLAKQEKLNIKVESCGISAENGIEMSIFAKRALKKIGINAGGKKSKKLNKIESNAIYVVMTNQIKSFLPYKNVFSFAELVGGQDIIDPYGESQEIYDKTALQILDCCEKLLIRLKNILN